MTEADSPEVLERFHSELPLVRIIAAQVTRSIGHRVEFDDLASAGREGLLEAARRFEANRGVPFRAYANFRVRGAVIDAVRRLSALPRRLHERLAALEAAALVSEGEAEHAFAQSGNKTASAADRALATHLSAIAMAAAVSMSAENHSEPVETGNSPEEALIRAQLANSVRTAVATLPKEEAELIRRHYLEGERFDEIAADLNLSKSWASRLHTRAVARLAKRLGDAAEAP